MLITLTMVSFWGYWLYFVYFLVSVLFSILINGLFLRFSKTLGIREKDISSVRWEGKSKPSFGGISFYLLFLLSVIAHILFFDGNVILQNKALIGLIIACTLAFIMGLSDDAYDTKPLLKLGAQIACACILIYSGIYIKLFPFTSLNYLLTIVWIVGLMNAINMLDNMDAITTVVSMSIIITILGFLIVFNDWKNSYFVVLLGVVGALAGFLFFNWNPSKLYMGDTGSQFLGVFLASMGIEFFWNIGPVSMELSYIQQFFIAIIAFIVPIMDTSIVVINRLAKKQSPFIGGKDHTTHHLFYRGITEKRIAILYFALSAFSAFLALFMISYPLTITSFLFTFVLVFYSVTTFIILFRVTRKG